MSVSSMSITHYTGFTGRDHGFRQSNMNLNFSAEVVSGTAWLLTREGVVECIVQGKLKVNEISFTIIGEDGRLKIEHTGLKCENNNLAGTFKQGAGYQGGFLFMQD